MLLKDWPFARKQGDIEAENQPARKLEIAYQCMLNEADWMLRKLVVFFWVIGLILLSIICVFNVLCNWVIVEYLEAVINDRQLIKCSLLHQTTLSHLSRLSRRSHANPSLCLPLLFSYKIGQFYQWHWHNQRVLSLGCLFATYRRRVPASQQSEIRLDCNSIPQWKRNGRCLR